MLSPLISVELRVVITKLLTEKYFENKVRTIPYGAEYFFMALEEIAYNYSSNGTGGAHEKALKRFIKSHDEITIIFGESCIREDLWLLPRILSKMPLGHVYDKSQKMFFSITGGPDLTADEYNSFTGIISDYVAERASIAFGASLDEELEGSIRATVLLGN